MPTETHNALKEYISDLEKKQEEIAAAMELDSTIDESALDDEVLRLPRMQSKYNNLYLREFNVYSDTLEMKKAFKLERWKYYTGKQTNRYYSEHGRLNEAINKTDVDKYLDADEIMQLISKASNIQKAITDSIERFSKELSNRGYNLKLCFDYRKWIANV